jgi:putative ABC transport system permease protein
VLSLHWLGAIDRLSDSYFFEAQHQDVTVGLSEIRPISAVNDFSRLPGVLVVEPYRHLGTRLHHGGRSHRAGLFGAPGDARLSPIHDSERGPLPVPETGLVLSTKLAEILDARVGDMVTVEALEGRRPVVDVPVVATFETYIGASGYMHLDAMNRMMRDPPVLSGVHMLVDPTRETELFRELKRMPGVWAVMLRQAAIDSFRGTVAETIVIYLSFFVTFACVLAFGVVYNSARIALSERGRELATLRVLGFSRLDISYIMLAEIGALVLIALPLGCASGAALAWFLSDSFETELFRIPLALEGPTFAYSIMIGIVASLASAAVVRRRLDTLDLISVLKTRE